LDLTGTGRILVVEHEPDLRSLIARGLRMRGYTVIEAGNGIEALKALEATTVDLIVCDVGMPEMSGPALLRTIRARGLRLPVIFMSGTAEKDLPSDVAFIAKPFGLAQLVRTVKEALRPVVA
jgi:two-component system, cell cycle sensor histidine kinase and response regulator CckA